MRKNRTIFLLLVASILASSDGNTNDVSCGKPHVGEKSADPDAINSDEKLNEVFFLNEDTQIREDVVQETHFEEEITHFNFKKSYDRIIDDIYPTSSKRIRLQKRSVKDCTPTVPKCNVSYKYRNISGVCNNLKNPNWGRAMTCQNRLLAPNYDGVSGIRRAADGGSLPEARNISVTINKDKDEPSKILSHLAMFFGQLCAHDITLTSENQQADAATLQCCQIQDDSLCYVIKVPKDDYFYSKYNITCLNYARAAECNSCDKDKKQVYNMQTSFIDASFIYGTSDEQAQSLRARDGTGRMLSQKSKYGELLPNSSNPQNDECSFPDKGKLCFDAGDIRANQHTTLTCLQTIFLRQHNRIATDLKKMNPHWDDERLYQETRRIMIAVMQQLTYVEYIPLILNNETISKYEIGVSDSYTEYDSKIDPRMLVEFSGAAFRVFHSMINTVVAKEPLKVTEGFQKMRDLYFRPFGLRDGSCDPLLKYTTNTPSQKTDKYQVMDATDFLYRVPGNETGNDLAATDINRGRDIGLPTYVALVKLCQNIEISSFDDLTKYGLMSKDNKDMLKKTYRNVTDVDSETAIMMENHLSGSEVGNTTACIMGIQFQRLKIGDRFFYTHKNQTGSFTESQLKEIKKITLTKIFCNNTGIDRLPEKSMLLPGKNNPLVECSNLTGLDLSKWKENNTPTSSIGIKLNI